jgi:hypothetical protein
MRGTASRSNHLQQPRFKPLCAIRQFGVHLPAQVIVSPVDMAARLI